MIAGGSANATAGMLSRYLLYVSSAPMLAAARAAAAAEGMAVEWWEGSAVKPLADAAFEVVFCQQGLQFFPDRVSALREIYRVLTPGGRLVLSVWGPTKRLIEENGGDLVKTISQLKEPVSDLELLRDSGRVTRDKYAIVRSACETSLLDIEVLFEATGETRIQFRDPNYVIPVPKPAKHEPGK